MVFFIFFFSSRRRHTRFDCDWSSDVCSSDLPLVGAQVHAVVRGANAFAGQRTPVPGAASSVAARQAAGPVDDALPGDPLSAGVRDPPHLTCRPRSAGQLGNLPVRDHATSGDGANERVHTADECLPPAHHLSALRARARDEITQGSGGTTRGTRTAAGTASM